MTVHGTYAAFSQRLYTRLGIGANGDGAKALRLLSRTPDDVNLRQRRRTAPM